MSTRLWKGVCQILAAAALATGMAGSAPAAVPESTDPIKIGWMNFTGAQVSAKIVGTVLESMGYKVEYVPITEEAQWQAMEDEDLNLQAEQWLVTQRHNYEKQLAKGAIVELGPNGIVGQEGWFYPKYVEAKCSGLPKWEALKNCGELFATAETAPKGRVVDYPEEWTPDSAKWIEALGLPLEPVPAGGEGALVAEIKSAFARQEPVMVMFWQPHWALLEYDMGVVEFPTWEEACETDPKWGANPEKVFDCGPPIPRIVKFGSPEFPKKWPIAYEVAKRFKIDNTIQQGLMKAIEVDKVETDAAVKDWLDQNEAVWKPWVEGLN
jgi:glycine betaine/proline transport system substrate-binding protein